LTQPTLWLSLADFVCAPGDFAVCLAAYFAGVISAAREM
jgi:hypothetical protein